jgi:hypothetical protein
MEAGRRVLPGRRGDRDLRWRSTSPRLGSRRLGWYVELRPANVIALSPWWSRQSGAAIVLLGVLIVSIIVFLGLTWRRQAGWVLTTLVASLIAQGAFHEASGAAANSRFSLKAFAGEVAGVAGPVYFYGPVIPQIVYQARRHIHHASIEDWPVGRPFFVIATEEQLAEFRSTFPVHEVAAGEGRVGESDNVRLLLLLINGPPRRGSR